MTAVLSDPARSQREANVAVVVNASDQAHFSFTGEAPFEAARPEWARLTFLADHDIADLGTLLERGEVDAVVFASNAFSTAAARRAIRGDFARLWATDGPAHDVGVLVLHQYLTGGTVLSLDFLGAATCSLVADKPLHVEADAFRSDPAWQFAEPHIAALSKGYGQSEHVSWTRVKPRYPDQWQKLVWQHEGAQLIDVCATRERTVISSRIPLDFMNSSELLRSLIAACLRRRGCLLVKHHDTSGPRVFTPALASAIERGRFVHQITPADAAEIDPAATPYRYFDELIVAPEWPVQELVKLDERAIQRKLEQGGSLVATFAGPSGAAVTVRLAHEPQYAARANHLAAWLLPNLASFKGDISAMHGLARAVAATRRAFRDERLIPQALRAEFVRKHLLAALLARIKDGSVDGLVLPTLGVYATLRDLGVGGHENLKTWVDEHLDAEPTDSIVAQAMLHEPELATEARRQRVLAALDGPDGPDHRLLVVYGAALFAAERGPLLGEAAEDPSLGLGAQAELLSALARREAAATDEVLGLASRVRERIDRLAEGEGALDTICVGNAALIDLAAQQGIGPPAAIRGYRPRTDAVEAVANTELVRSREEAQRDAARFELVGRQATTALVGLLIVLIIGALVGILLFLHGAFLDRVKFALTIFGVLSGFTLYVLRKARAAGLPPAFGMPKPRAEEDQAKG